MVSGQAHQALVVLLAPRRGRTVEGQTLCLTLAIFTWVFRLIRGIIQPLTDVVADVIKALEAAERNAQKDTPKGI